MSTPHSTHPRRASALVIFWIFFSFILATGGIVAGVFNYYQDAQINEQLETMITVPQASVIEIQQMLTSDQGQLAAQQIQISDLQKTVTTLQHQIITYQPENLAWLKRQNRAMHHQVGQLQALSMVMHLQLAQQLLLTQQNKNTILTELTQVSDMLQLTGRNPATAKALLQLSQQVAQLPVIDTTAALNGLQPLNTQLSGLHFISAVPVADNPGTRDQNRTWWQRQIDALKHLVVIHDNDTLSQHLLTQTDRINAIRTIQLWISAATTSAWQGNQEQYQLALQQAIHSVQQFTQGDAAQAQWLQAAQQLNNQAVGYSSSNIRACLPPLQALISALQTPGIPAGGH